MPQKAAPLRLLVSVYRPDLTRLRLQWCFPITTCVATLRHAHALRSAPQSAPRSAPQMDLVLVSTNHTPFRVRP